MPSYSGVFTLQAQMQAKAANTWPEYPPTVIGQAYGGGFYAGQIGVSSVATHYLVVGPVASAESSSKQYKNATTATAGSDSVINGPQNTADIVADGDATTYPAAHFCNNLVIGGFTDWYLPAVNEMEVCYFNLKPNTNVNNTGYGINPNAVPARASNYTSGNPAQTSASAFITSSGAEAFGLTTYWTSSEFSATNVFGPYMVNGTTYSHSKTNSFRVRAIRRVPV